jgi:hypothetical protein
LRFLPRDISAEYLRDDVGARDLDNAGNWRLAVLDNCAATPLSAAEHLGIALRRSAGKESS